MDYRKTFCQGLCTNLPPYFIPKEDGAPEEIAIDYLSLISERTGLKLEYYSSDKTFAEALNGLKKHQGPDLVGVLTHTPELQREILFSKEYLKAPYVIFTHTDEKHIITGISDILSKRIAISQGTTRMSTCSFLTRTLKLLKQLQLQKPMPISAICS